MICLANYLKLSHLFSKKLIFSGPSLILLSHTSFVTVQFDLLSADGNEGECNP